MLETPSEIARKLRPAERKALRSRDGSGDYSTATFERLQARRLVDRNFLLTDLGVEVRDALTLLS